MFVIFFLGFLQHLVCFVVHALCEEDRITAGRDRIWPNLIWPNLANFSFWWGGWWGPEGVGTRRVGGPKFRAFFLSLSRRKFHSFFSGGSSRGILVVFEAPGHI